MVVNVKKIIGKEVAVCKSSHGKHERTFGYILVSLNRMVISVPIEQSPQRPSHLLSGFISIYPPDHQHSDSSDGYVSDVSDIFSEE
ncbi:predicted protein [Arabidopsis lyrata subsp. lyrata]|uniref:Predicted protein n=1 Tax=Arabidopsis lyrata subsp. lyrata TaxID=81972 RepID=D7KMR4_ARALL|nr:predicted protein [Arabidopsis lyrata subsp. lyrata]